MKLPFPILLVIFTANAWACGDGAPPPKPEPQKPDPNNSLRPIFDTPENPAGDINVRLVEPLKPSQRREMRLHHAIAYHIKNLRDPDPDVQTSSCEMLGVLMQRAAIGPLIEVLNPERKSAKKVLIAAHQALLKLTDQKFAQDDYSGWSDWWKKVPADEQHGEAQEKEKKSAKAVR